MILLGLGANLRSPVYGAPRATLEAALGLLADAGIAVVRRSRWYASAPEAPSDDGQQGWYTNGAAVLGTDLDAGKLLARLLAVEAEMGRTRRIRNEARVIDLDLLAYGDLVVAKEADEATHGGPELVLPHPRMHARPFVLLPVAEVAPGWRHPGLGVTVEELIAALPQAGLAMPVP